MQARRNGEALKMMMATTMKQWHSLRCERWLYYLSLDEKYIHSNSSNRSPQNLKTLFDAVAWIDFDIFTSSVKALVVQTIDSVDSGAQSLSWNDVEVALYVLYILGEPATKG